MELEARDLDAQFLEQFSALGTTDKDELVNQLKSVVGSELTPESCRFFLELSGWNLQRAIGAYFDFSFESSPTSSSPMTTVANLNPPDNYNMIHQDTDIEVSPKFYDLRIWPNPNQTIEKNGSFKVTIENCGSESWPEGIYLRSEPNLSIAKMCTRIPETQQVLWLPIGPEGRIPILPILPSQMVDLTLNVIPPTTFSHIRPIVGAMTFCLPSGDSFGETLYCTAVFDVETSTWLFLRGVVEELREVHQSSPMLMEEI